MSSRNSSGTAPWAAGSAVEGRRPAGAVGMPGTSRSRRKTRGEALQVPRAAFMMLLSMAWVPPQGRQEQSSPWRSAEMGTSFPCEILNWLFLVPGDCPVQTRQAGGLGAEGMSAGQRSRRRSPPAGRCLSHPADLATSQRQAADQVLKEFSGLAWVFFLLFFFNSTPHPFPCFNVQGLQGLFCQPAFVMAAGECLLRRLSWHGDNLSVYLPALQIWELSCPKLGWPLITGSLGFLRKGT